MATTTPVPASSISRSATPDDSQSAFSTTLAETGKMVTIMPILTSSISQSATPDDSQSGLSTALAVSRNMTKRMSVSFSATSQSAISGVSQSTSSTALSDTRSTRTTRGCFMSLSTLCKSYRGLSARLAQVRWLFFPKPNLLTMKAL